MTDPGSRGLGKGPFGHFPERENSQEPSLVNQCRSPGGVQCDAEPSCSWGSDPNVLMCEQEESRRLRACDSHANGSHDHPVLVRVEEGSALPEALFLPSDGCGYPSRPCEGRCLSIVDEHDVEGHCQLSTKRSLDVSNRSILNLCEGVDAGSTVLGDFVLNNRSQVPSFVERGPIVSRAQRGDDFCFDDRPIVVKVWFAPHHSCNIVAKDVTLEPQHFGNIQEEVCRVWSDAIPPSLCSYRTISPQPDEQTYGQMLHLVVFGTGSPAAVLIRQSSALSDNFCACALSPFHPLRKRHELELQRFWKHGELMHIEAQRHGNVCTHTTESTSAHLGQRVDQGRDYIADVMSLMQTTAEQRETIAGARYAHAIQYQRAYHGVANFATQNFVKNDDLRRWIETLPFYEAREGLILAVWRIEPGRAVTMSCDRIRLNEGNWARTFRTYWKAEEVYKTPKLAAVEPQPALISHRDFQQIEWMLWIPGLAEAKQPMGSFFSGRRRVGDLQQALEGLNPPDATLLFVISLDVMVNAEHGNLTDENQQQAILRLIRQGGIAAGYAGPPCETWTVARFEKVATRRHAPRPLRLKDQPWGLLHVGYKEGRQLEIGNELMCFAVHALFEIAAMGGLSVLEHPRNPHDWNTKHAQAPSIWDTAIIRWLSSTGLFHSLAVSQGNFGAKSAKPTTFFIAGLSHETTAAMEAAARTTHCPRAASIGLCSGEWATSSLKEYPPDLCMFLASLFDRWLQGTMKESGTFPVDVSWLKAMHVTEIQHVQKEGPDFHPSLIQNL